MSVSRILIAFFVTTFFLQTLVYSETIVAGVGVWKPWQECVPGKKDCKGILPEIFRMAVSMAGHQPALRGVPHNRRNEVEWGKKVDAELGCIPEWREKYKDVSVYTIPIIRTVNVVLAEKGKLPKTDTIETFYGKSVGTTLGYHYTDGFTEAFESGKIKRDDSREGPTIIRKLIGHRVDGAILDRYEALYWLKEMMLVPGDFEEVYEFKTVTDLRIRLHKNKNHLITDINKAIEKMKKDGVIRKIIDNYTR